MLEANDARRNQLGGRESPRGRHRAAMGGGAFWGPLGVPQNHSAKPGVRVTLIEWDGRIQPASQPITNKKR